MRQSVIVELAQLLFLISRFLVAQLVQPGLRDLLVKTGHKVQRR